METPERQRILAELQAILAMPKSYIEQNGGFDAWRLGLSDWIGEDVLLELEVKNTQRGETK